MEAPYALGPIAMYSGYGAATADEVPDQRNAENRYVKGWVQARAAESVGPRETLVELPLAKVQAV